MNWQKQQQKDMEELRDKHTAMVRDMIERGDKEALAKYIAPMLNERFADGVDWADLMPKPEMSEAGRTLFDEITGINRAYLDSLGIRAERR